MTRHSLLLSLGVVLMPFGCSLATEPPFQVLGPTSLPFALPNVAYGHRLTAFGGGGEHTWALASGSGPLPVGLSLATDGLISGTPTTVGVSDFTVEVEGRDGQTAQAVLSITVPPVLEPDERCADFPEYALPTFSDVNLQRAVEAAVPVGSQKYLTCGELPGLRDLQAMSQAIESLVGIHNLTNLRYLYLSNNAITDLGPLVGMTSLSILDVGGNPLSDMTVLGTLSNLHILSLGNSSLVEIGALAGLIAAPDLWMIALSNNSISDLGPLSALTGLVQLDLSGNSISDLSALGGLTLLRFLDLTRNSINDLSPLSGVTSLSFLDIGENAITDLGPLSVLGSLHSVRLPDNSVTDLGPLAGITSLRHVFLDKNSVVDLGPMEGLTLETLDLDDNPTLTNVQPLLDGKGLSSFFHRVYLRNTGVSCTDIDALGAMGVTVESDCP